MLESHKIIDICVYLFLAPLHLTSHKVLLLTELHLLDYMFFMPLQYR